MENGTRLNKYIAMHGICSRREADNYILAQKVIVNGKIATLGQVVTDDDNIEIVGKRLEASSATKEHIYLAFNKPVGVVTTMKEQFNRKCVADFIPKKYGRLFPVGRLDMDSSGLLILTNDGELANVLMHPKTEVEKEYEVTLNKEISDVDIQCMEQGVDIGGYITKKAKIIKLNAKCLKIIIHEGKNRQVRRMCEALGYLVIKLNRVREGKIALNNLELGKVKELKKEDMV